MDARWNITKADNRAYYRVTEKTDSGYRIVDHYLDGRPQMCGLSLSPELNSREYWNGNFVYYDSLGNKTNRGRYENGKKTGIWYKYHKGSEKLSEQCQYVEDALSGHIVYYDSTTSLKLGEGDVYKGGLVGTWKLYTDTAVHYQSKFVKTRLRETIEFDEQGRVKKVCAYRNGKVKRRECYNSTGEVVACDDNLVEFTTGRQAPYPHFKLNKFLSLHLQYPMMAQTLGIAGAVWVKFMINEDGSVSNVSVIEGIGGGCDEVAVHAVRQMPKWNPAIRNNVPVKSYYKLGIAFAYRKVGAIVQGNAPIIP